MKFKKPLFWDLKKPNLISFFLSPFTILIRINNFFLNSKSKEKNHKIKTICVGNIYLGGTGKTPTTIKLYEIFKKLGINVSTAKKFYNSQNDEEIILKNKTDLVSGKNRKEIVEKAVKENKEILIFDDGLQDKNINYDLQFVCFDIKKWIGNGKLIPAGPLREKLDSIKKYDGVFLKNKSEKTEEIINLIKSINPKIEIFITNYNLKNLLNLNKNEKFVIFSGIGNPESFKDTLKDNNFKIVREIVFPDHYQYKKKDIEKIKTIADSLNAKIITTEKDFVKIRNYNIPNIDYLDIDLEFINEKDLIKFLNKRLYEKN